MDTSIIIVNYNTTALTKDCIRSIYQHTVKNSFEIIVVDNASADRGIEEINNVYPEVRLILNKQNVGFGKANNQAISVSKGKYVFLLNSDTLLTSDAVSIFFEYMEDPGHEKIFCCGGELIKPDGARQTSFGNFPTLTEAISVLGFFIFYKRYFNRNISSGVFNYSDEIKKVDYICGADMFIRAAMLQKTSIFDPEFFLYFEETELSFRMAKIGYQSVLIPDVKIIHLEGASMGGHGSYDQKLIIYATSRRLFFNKCYGRLSAMLVNKIYAIQALIFFLTKWKTWYFRSALILFRL